MSKEEYYSKIKKFVYRRFDELEVFESNDRDILYLCYKNGDSAQIKINKNSLKVYYSYRLSNKIYKTISLKETDFEILLKRWVEETFKIKVINTISISSQENIARLLKIPFK